VFVVTMLETLPTVHVQSGRKPETYEARAGMWSHSVPVGVGRQSAKVVRGEKTVDPFSFVCD
jgi:hypothetical protein